MSYLDEAIGFDGGSEEPASIETNVAEQESPAEQQVEQEPQRDPAEEPSKGEPTDAAPEAKGDERTAPPAATSSEETRDSNWVPKTALLDERTKRQQAEQELAMLRSGGNATSNSSQDSFDEDDKFFENPGAFTRETVDRQVKKHVINMSEQMVSSQHSDYWEARKAFESAAENAPHLWGMVRNADNPAMYVYQYGKNVMQASQYGSIDEMRESIRKEEREKLELEMRKSKAQSDAEKVNKTIASTNGAPSKATQEVPKLVFALDA